MPANKGRIAKNAMMLYIRMGVVMVVSLYTARVVLQQLGASDYGLHNVVGGIITLLSFMTGALSSGVQRFYNVYKAKKDYDTISKIYSSSLVIMLGFAIVLIVLSETVGLWFLNNKMNIPVNRLVAANWVFQFSIITTLGSIAVIPFNAMITAHEDFNIIAFMGIFMAAGNLGISFLLRLAPFDKLIFYSGIMMVFLLFCHVITISITRVKYKRIRLVKHKDKEIYKSLLSFSGWNILGTSMFMVGTQGVNIILNIFFGTIVNAARGIAVQISTKVDELIKNLQTATDPQIIQLYAKGDLRGVESLVDDNFRWNFSMYWLIALPILFEIDYILKIWLGDVPEFTGLFTTIIILRSLLKCFERPINTLNFAIGDMKAINIFATISVTVTTFLMCLCFAVGFEPYWAFIWDIISITACITYYMCRSRKYHAFSFRHFIAKILLPTFLVIGITTGGTYLLRLVPLQGLAQLLYTLVITSCLSSVCIYSFLLTKDMRRRVLQRIKSKIR